MNRDMTKKGQKHAVYAVSSQTVTSNIRECLLDMESFADHQLSTVSSSYFMRLAVQHSISHVASPNYSSLSSWVGALDCKEALQDKDAGHAWNPAINNGRDKNNSWWRILVLLALHQQQVCWCITPSLVSTWLSTNHYHFIVDGTDGTMVDGTEWPKWTVTSFVWLG